MTKPTATGLSLEVKILHAINMNLKWFKKWAPIWVLWLTIVIFICTVVPQAFGQGLDPIGNVSAEAGPFSVSVVSVSCFEGRWFDNWVTTSTAGWPTDYPNPTLNRYWVQARIDGVIMVEAPMGRGTMDISGLPSGELAFSVENRRTGERTWVNLGPINTASCSFFPPPDGSAWVWSSAENRFELRQVPRLGPPHKLETEWVTE